MNYCVCLREGGGEKRDFQRTLVAAYTVMYGNGAVEAKEDTFTITPRLLNECVCRGETYG